MSTEKNNSQNVSGKVGADIHCPRLRSLSGSGGFLKN